MFPSFKSLIKNLQANSAKTKQVNWHYSDSEILTMLEALKNNTHVSTIIDFPAKNPLLFRALADMLSVNTSITTVWLNLSPPYPFTERLIDTETFEYLIDKIRLNRSIKTFYLNLNGMLLSDQAFRFLFDFIHQNKQLASLELTHTTLPNHVFDEFIQAIEQSTIKKLLFSTVQASDFSWLKVIQVFAQRPLLTHLALENCGITDAVLIQAKTVLSAIKKQKLLILTKNDLSESAFEALAESVLNHGKLYVHFIQKKADSSLFRFETSYITPFLKEKRNMFDSFIALYRF
jgi:hypothetical protein